MQPSVISNYGPILNLYAQITEKDVYIVNNWIIIMLAAAEHTVCSTLVSDVTTALLLNNSSQSNDLKINSDWNIISIVVFPDLDATFGMFEASAIYQNQTAAG